MVISHHTPEGNTLRVSWLPLRLCVRCISVAIIPVRMDGMRPDLHQSLHCGNSRFFSPAEQHRPPPTQSPFSTPITAEPQGRAAALQWTAGSECWVSSSAQRPLSGRPGELLMDQSVRACVRACALCTMPQNHPPFPKCNTGRLHLYRMLILKLSSLSHAWNLNATNWIRICGGFPPAGSAWSPACSCNSCQSCGGTEVHVWRGGSCS